MGVALQGLLSSKHNRKRFGMLNFRTAFDSHFFLTILHADELTLL
jgi:hypothetical protein